jgi:hypothetical protein
MGVISSFILSLIIGVQPHPDAGTTGFNFLKLGASAREVGMGWAGIGSPHDAGTVFWNPGSILAGTKSVNLTYLNYVAGINSGYLSYLMPGEKFGYGLSLAYLSSGTIKRTDQDNRDLGSFLAHYSSLNLSGGIKIAEVLSLGLTSKFLYARLDTFWSWGGALDIGIAYQTPYPPLRLGGVVQNLGYQFREFYSARDRLPLDFGIGLGYSPLAPLTLVLDLHKPVDNRLNLRSGLEYRLHPLLGLRLGYNSLLGTELKTGGGLDILAGTCFGLGFSRGALDLDYAYTPYLELGNDHRFSLSYRFH